MQSADTHKMVTSIKFHDGALSDNFAIVTILLKSLAQLAHREDADRDRHVSPKRKNIDMTEGAIRRTIEQGALSVVSPDFEVCCMDAACRSFHNSAVNPPIQLLRSELTDGREEAWLCAFEIMHGRS